MAFNRRASELKGKLEAKIVVKKRTFNQNTAVLSMCPLPRHVLY